MKQSQLSKWLKLIIVGVGLCGLLIYLWIIPSFGRMLVSNNPEFDYCYIPWLIFVWITAVPCYAALVFAWKISCNIGNNKSFCLDNSRWLKQIAILAAADSGFVFITNIVFLFLGMNHPGIVLMSLIIVFFGIAVSVASAVLSHLVIKATELQDQSDLTI